MPENAEEKADCGILKGNALQASGASGRNQFLCENNGLGVFFVNSAYLAHLFCGERR
jgi:hypothetical protein